MESDRSLVVVVVESNCSPMVVVESPSVVVWEEREWGPVVEGSGDVVRSITEVDVEGRWRAP